MFTHIATDLDGCNPKLSGLVLGKEEQFPMTFDHIGQGIIKGFSHAVIIQFQNAGPIFITDLGLPSAFKLTDHAPVYLITITQDFARAASVAADKFI